MTALLENGLDVTALHNHFFWDEPHMFYMHAHGRRGPRILPGLAREIRRSGAAISPTFRSVRLIP
jgi:hypothetical protein